ncbi:uncharacterized protein LOC118560093 [Fundulus heteroclitus]|uniref:uncharacterized protein LOC118560093 n=1 Tax=Fundulus heteroclitus TaxID=8078 RepID=UPI00165C5093|nr:uncharacterized protein LOC118560093 [Fundulus heteroclitus]
MILKGLPDEFKPFSVYITQSDEELTFAQFKMKLRSDGSTEKLCVAGSAEDCVMKVKGRDNWSIKLPCYNCGQRGHKSLDCPSTSGKRSELKQWCSFCKTTTHKNANCRRKRRDKVKQAMNEEDHTFAFKVKQSDDAQIYGTKVKGLMVDSGATKHIVTDAAKFKDFNSTFKPQSHILELADGVRTSGIALKKGTARVRLRDSNGRIVEMMLMDTLYVLSFSQDILLVKAATAQGATVIFKDGQIRLIHKNGSHVMCLRQWEKLCAHHSQNYGLKL